LSADVAKVADTSDAAQAAFAFAASSYRLCRCRAASTVTGAYALAAMLRQRFIFDADLRSFFAESPPPIPPPFRFACFSRFPAAVLISSPDDYAAFSPLYSMPPPRPDAVASALRLRR
jgi:hypothetical protein